MDMNSRGPRTVVVTGASSGIGRATALRLHEEGYRVLAIARRRERLEDLARMVNDPEKFDVLQCDVSVDEDVERVAEYVEREFGGVLTSLCNIAGGALGIEQVADAAFDKWEGMFRSNVIGSGRVTKALLPALEASGHGDVVFLTSTASQAAYEGGSGYNAAKAGEQ